jgi:hypothetical protein
MLMVTFVSTTGRAEGARTVSAPGQPCRTEPGHRSP